MSDFTFNEFLTGILKFNDENVMHIGFNSDTEDIIITNWNASADTAKTLQTNLNGGGGSAVLGQKTITANGTYNASDDSLDGYDQVTVNVPGLSIDDIATGAAPSGNVDITANKIEYGKFSYTTNLNSVNMPNVTTIGQSAFFHSSLKDVYAPGLTAPSQAAGAFAYTGLTQITDGEFPNITSLNAAGTTAFFEYCTSVTKIFMSKVTQCGNNTFRRQSNLLTAVFPEWTGYCGATAFEYCDALTGADFKKPGLATGVFSHCTNMDTLIIRDAETMASLTNVNAFASTPFASDGTGGTLYVPQAMISTYESGTNWAAILAYPNNTITAIEGSAYETKYVDGTEIAP